jgi:hypothetical protein
VAKKGKQVDRPDLLAAQLAEWRREREIKAAHRVITSELVTRSPDSCATTSDTSTDSTSASRQSTPVKDLIRRFSANELGSPIFQKYKPGPSGTTRPYIQPSKVSPPPQQHTYTEIAQPPTVLSPPDIKLEDAPALPTPRVQAIPGSWSPGANIKFGDIETIIPAHVHAGDTDIDIPDAPPEPVKGKKPPLQLSTAAARRRSCQSAIARGRRYYIGWTGEAWIMDHQISHWVEAIPVTAPRGKTRQALFYARPTHKYSPHP